MIRKLFVTVVAMLLVLVHTTTASASADLMVGPGTITASPAINPGQSIQLPTHEITNNSYRALEMTVSVSGRADDERVLPPAEWFSITPAELIVQARSSGEVQVELVLPDDAPPGEYKVWFLFDSMPIGGSGMITAAAINVSFTFDVADVRETASEDQEESVNEEPEESTEDPPDESGTTQPNSEDTDETEDTNSDGKDPEDEATSNTDTEDGITEADNPGDEPDEQEGLATQDENNPTEDSATLPWVGAGVLLVALVLGGVYLRRKFSN